MTHVPAPGTKVRLAKFGDLGAIGTVEGERIQGFAAVHVFVRWPQGGGMWAGIDELEEVKS